jgi:hypothetical protein
MDRHPSTLLAIVIAAAVGCTNAATRPGPPPTNHVVTVSTTSNPGGPGNPSIITYVWQPAGDMITWKSVDGTLTFTWITTPNPYSHESCPSSKECDSGAFGGSWNSDQQFDYKLMVGTYGPIYGRIIIKP